jgi:3-isopropylmalate/(R)-2-methylmalate dehydratase small subunit
LSIIKERVLVKLGDHIDTDLLSPAGALPNGFDPELIGTVCLQALDPDFPKKMSGGGIIVAGINFGCGSSRESAALAVKKNNCKALIAEEFARIFYRNAINLGLVCIECKGISTAAEVGDELEVDIETGRIYNISRRRELKGTSIPTQVRELFASGGLIPYLKQTLGKA